MDRLSIIIPCYFNEKNIPVTFKRLTQTEKELSEIIELEYIFIDDNSKDNTYAELKNIYTQNTSNITVIKLVKNSGSHSAVMAGLEYATGNCNIILAADLQDPPELIPKMINFWKSGIKLVIANRESRDDSVTSKLFASLFHFLFRKLAIKDIPKGGYDLILFDKVIRDKLLQMKEKNTNITYLISWLGYEYVNIPYRREKRNIGKSKWTLSKRIKLFVDSFVAFSFAPLRAISITSFIVGLGSLFYLFILAFYYIVYGNPVQGWSSLMIAILFLGSIQLFFLGIIGEYLWRILDQQRNRPSYIIDEVLKPKNTK